MSIDERTIDAAAAAVAEVSWLTASAQGRLLDGETLTNAGDNPV